MISVGTALTIAMILTAVGLVAASIRLVLGPTRADRVVALDLITVLLVAIAAQLSLLFEEAAYLDLGLAIALIGFLATVAFARYVENAPQVWENATDSRYRTPQENTTPDKTPDNESVES